MKKIQKFEWRPRHFTGCVDTSLGNWHRTGGSLHAIFEDGTEIGVYSEVAQNTAAAGFNIQLVGTVTNLNIARRFGQYGIQNKEKMVMWCMRHPEIFQDPKERRTPTGTELERKYAGSVRNILGNLQFLRVHGRPFLNQTREVCLARLREIFGGLRTPVGRLP